MKAILTPCILTGIRSKADGSLGLSFSTPELTSAEKTAWMDLHGKNAKMLLEPMDSEPEPPIEVKAEMEQKTCGQRLRASLFVLWRQQGSAGDFEVAYKGYIEKVISSVKAKLEP